MKKEKIDLSSIKDDELDKTASFTDLMTRSERRQHKKSKKLEDTSSLYEIKEDEFIKEDENISKKKRSKIDLEEMINEEKDVDDTKELPVVSNDDCICRTSMGAVITLLILNIGCLGYFIYSIFNDTYSIKMIIGSGLILTLAILFYCFILTEPNKKNKGLIIFNSLFIVLYIVYNYLILSDLYKRIIELAEKVIPFF